jgi:conserved hypothetical protein
MRLWPLSILKQLPRQQLLGQHRECCALRGLGWGKKHSVVDYVFRHPRFFLYEYHSKIISEMERRGYKADPVWKDSSYRGKRIGKDFSLDTSLKSPFPEIYPEHDFSYLNECVENLERKGVKINRDFLDKNGVSE